MHLGFYILDTVGFAWNLDDYKLPNFSLCGRTASIYIALLAGLNLTAP